MYLHKVSLNNLWGKIAHRSIIFFIQIKNKLFNQTHILYERICPLKYRRQLLNKHFAKGNNNNITIVMRRVVLDVCVCKFPREIAARISSCRCASFECMVMTLCTQSDDARPTRASLFHFCKRGLSGATSYIFHHPARTSLVVVGYMNKTPSPIVNFPKSHPISMQIVATLQSA